MKVSKSLLVLYFKLIVNKNFKIIFTNFKIKFGNFDKSFDNFVKLLL